MFASFRIHVSYKEKKKTFGHFVLNDKVETKFSFSLENKTIVIVWIKSMHNVNKTNLNIKGEVSPL